MGADNIKVFLMHKGQNEIDGIQISWMAYSERMGDPAEDSKEAIAARLTSLPKACGYASHAAFAAYLGISPQRWHTARTTGNLSNELQALLVHKITGMTYEWLKTGRGPTYLGRNDTTSVGHRSKHRP